LAVSAPSVGGGRAGIRILTTEDGFVIDPTLTYTDQWLNEPKKILGFLLVLPSVSSMGHCNVIPS
jgi:hypothetical protein